MNRLISIEQIYDKKIVKLALLFLDSKGEPIPKMIIFDDLKELNLICQKKNLE
jgi:hypothetical protein